MGNKNLKDPKGKPTASYGAGSQNMSITVFSYTKTDKLITALYMVTDIIDKGEPLRNKLRTLGTGIISDTYSTPSNICSKISEIMSFLDIASAINIISEMNCNILRKEFSELDQSIKESIGNIQTLNRQINLSEFFRESARAGGELPPPKQSIGHLHPTRIGVQKGSTLMKALSDRVSVNNFGILKKQRRDDIINIIKTIGKSSTIKDIKDKVQANPEQARFLISCGEKTLQREMVSMVKDGVLNKTGKKRWSRYQLVNVAGLTSF